MPAVPSLWITARIRIDAGRLFRNGEKVFAFDDSSARAWLDAAYAGSGMVYPKFHKMDPLSRLGLLAVHHLLGERSLALEYDPYDIGLLMTNSHSSLDTDYRYRQSMDAISSPALFVYTLPNIMLGELCIKNNFKGHHAFFIFDRYQPDFLHSQVNGIFQAGMMKACICGWVDILEDKAEAAVFLVEPVMRNGGLPFNEINLVQ